MTKLSDCLTSFSGPSLALVAQARLIGRSSGVVTFGPLVKLGASLTPWMRIVIVAVALELPSLAR
jgi:hypothetical protein